MLIFCVEIKNMKGDHSSYKNYLNSIYVQQHQNNVSFLILHKTNHQLVWFIDAYLQISKNYPSSHNTFKGVSK